MSIDFLSHDQFSSTVESENSSKMLSIKSVSEKKKITRLKKCKKITITYSNAEI